MSLHHLRRLQELPEGEGQRKIFEMQQQLYGLAEK